MTQAEFDELINIKLNIKNMKKKTKIRYDYRFTVMTADGKPAKVFEKQFDNEHQAVLFRKTEEASTGQAVSLKYLRTVEVEEEPLESVVTQDLEPEVAVIPEDTVDDGKLDADLFDIAETDDDIEDYPRGWHRRTEFVSKYGTVYHKGEEQPELFRTLEPSDY